MAAGVSSFSLTTGAGLSSVQSTGVDMTTLPAEIILYIFSLLEDPQDVANLPIVCKKWYRIAKENGVWQRHVKRMGIPDYTIDPKHVMSVPEVANRIGVSLLNAIRIRDHIYAMSCAIVTSQPNQHFEEGERVNPGKYLSSMPRSQSEDFDLELISEFLHHFGLPINKKGAVPRKLPEMVMTSTGPAYGVPSSDRIYVTPNLVASRRARDILLKFRDRRGQAGQNLFLTNAFLSFALYEGHQRSNGTPLVSKLILKKTRNDFLSYTHAVLRVYFNEELKFPGKYAPVRTAKTYSIKDLDKSAS